LKIGIISDTHGCLATWEKAYHSYFSDTDLIIHAGDVLYHGPRNSIPAEYNPAQLAKVLNECSVPIVVACGNCDAEVDGMVLNMPIQSPYAYIVIDGLPIIVNHGHNLAANAKYEMAAKFKAKLFITGHTHIPVIEKRDHIVYLNPGSPAMSKRSDVRGTIALMVNGTIKVLDVATGEVLLSESLD
jgi:hypothetical protein